MGGWGMGVGGWGTAPIRVRNPRAQLPAHHVAPSLSSNPLRAFSVSPCLRGKNGLPKACRNQMTAAARPSLGEPGRWKTVISLR